MVIIQFYTIKTKVVTQKQHKSGKAVEKNIDKES